MSEAILLSIKPKFAQAILSGKKLFEYRKKVFRNSEAKIVYIYASYPVCKVVGKFRIQDIIENEIESLWDDTAFGAGISKEYFNSYFFNKKLGYAIKVTEPVKFEVPLSLKDSFEIEHPPQSFRYLNIQKNN